MLVSDWSISLTLVSDWSISLTLVSDWFRSGAWDPTVSNTPAQPGNFDNYDFDETSPSPNYNPGTPGYSAEGSSGPYTPTTPSSAYNPQVRRNILNNLYL